MKKLIFCCYFFTFFAFLYLFHDSDSFKVRLSEVVACNHTVIYDASGIFHDYIELYNHSSHPIDISGYHLSDSKRRLKRFTFPKNTVIAPRQYYLVWAGLFDSEKMFFGKNHLYTNFSVKTGEKIYFSDKEGNIIDKVKIPDDLECNISYSRIPSTHKWAKREPTPGKQNKLFHRKKITKIIPDVEVKFDAVSGFYDEPFELMMSAPDGFDIYYTLDVTPPTKKSLKYTKPIAINDASQNPNKFSDQKNFSPFYNDVPDYSIDKATIVRAVAVRRKDGAVSKISNASYFVGFQEKQEYQDMSVISVITDPDNLFGYEKGIYVTGKIGDMVGNSKHLPSFYTTANYAAEGKDWAREMYFDYIKNGISTGFSGKIKIQGKNSRRYIQKNFTFFDLQQTDAEYAGIRKFDIRAINQFSRVNEKLIYTLTADRSEILSHPPEDAAFLFLEGEFWGMYFIYDRITPEFITEKTELINPTLIDMQRSGKSYGQTHFDTNYETLDEIEKNINVDSLFSYVAINTYISNHDACNLIHWNVIRWKSSENPIYNKWQFMLYDLDNDLLSLTYDQFKNNSDCSLIVNNRILEKLFSSEKFKKQFIITFQDTANYNFNPEKVNRLLDEFETKYGPSAILSLNRFHPFSTNKEHFSGKIAELKDFYAHRFEHIMPYMKEYFGLKGELTEIEKMPSKVNGGNVLLNTIKLTADETFVGRYYSDYDISLNVETFSGYQFKGWLIDDKLITEEKLDLDLSEPHKIEAVWAEENN